MPYSTTTYKAVICPPKCGTTSIQHAFREIDPQMKAPDHMTYAETVRHMHENDYDPDLFDWAVNIRNPLDRLVSGVNSLTAVGRTIDDAMEQCVNDRSIIFKPQVHFLSEGKVAMHRAVFLLFDFDTMNIVRWLGWELPETPHLNASRSRHTRHEVMDHRWYDDCIKRYESDWPLWEIAKRMRE